MENEEISFEDLGLDDFILSAIEKKGFKTPSPIQVLAIPRLLNGDANIIAKARTGTGKTAAFGLPIVQRVHEESDHVRALVLEPTRELAIQTCTELQSFSEGKYPRVAVVYGGASYRDQIHDLKRGAEIVVGTPGRVQDHIERGTLKLDQIDYFILDEGDEMLDMGFVDDIEAIFSNANPNSRILLFSATMPPAILKIAQKFMGEYDICEEEGFVEEPLLIEQKYWFIRENEKIEALVRLIDISPNFYGIVFTQTKNDADTVTKMLDERGYDVAALHGDIPQGQREKIIARFRSRKTRVLVATDVAARGIDISGLTHVVNYSLPFDAATYVHRIGRTGRAGSEGIAVTFVRPEERRKLEYLRAAVRRAAKGEMKEEGVPSVSSVLDVKRSRMLDTLKVQLGLANDNTEEEPVKVDTFENDEVIPLDIETKKELLEAEESNIEDSAASEVSSFVPSLKPVDDIFTKMAEELSNGQDARAVLAGILSISYGKSLDESHYGKISASRNGNSANQKRIYVQLGRRDGYNARSIAEFFSNLLHIPGRMVDRIDVAESFSLVSLPTSNAERVLAMAKSDSSLPSMHLDSKSEDNFSRGGRDRGRGGRGFGGRDRNRFDRGSRYDVARGDKDHSRRERRAKESGRSGFRNEHGRPRVHTPTERSGASAYKKVSKSDQY